MVKKLNVTGKDGMIMKENKIRSKQVNLRLTEAEYRRLDEAAQASGLGRSAYLRMVLYASWLREGAKKRTIEKVSFARSATMKAQKPPP